MADSTSPAPARRRRLVTVSIALAAPIVALVALEVLLRLAGVGHPTSFFVRGELPDVFRTNPAFTHTFLPPTFDLKPEDFRLVKSKPADAVRVFVLGESAALGLPEPGFGLAPLLQAQLRAAAPNRPIEVLNLAVPGINSHVVRLIAEEALTFDPDLLVIYLGNNEVVGPFAPGTPLALSPSSTRLVRPTIAMRRTRIGQLLQRALAAMRSSDAQLREWRGLESLTGPPIAADDPALERAYQRFEENLRDILGAAADAGVPTLLATVAVNRRECAPFASLDGAARDEWREAFDAGKQALQNEAFDEAVASFQRALEFEPRHAETHFELARLLDLQGETADAERSFEQALQWDALRVRADAGINAVIRRQAQEAPGRVRLVDAASAMTEGEDRGGGAYFFDHVHLTWEGNVRLARELAQAATPLLLGRDHPRTLDAAECAQALGFTDFGRLVVLMAIDQLNAGPPFTRQVTYAAQRTRLKRAIAVVKAMLAAPEALEEAREQIERARSRTPENRFLWSHSASVRMETEDPAGALALLEELAERVPWSAELSVQRAFLLQQLGRSTEAEELLFAAIERDPYHPQTYALLGALWLSAGQLDRGRSYFQARVDELPGSLTARHLLARFLARDSEWSEAEEQWRAILQLQPDDAVALDGLLRRLFSRGREEEAVGLLEAAYAYNPKNPDVNSRLVQIYQNRRETELLVKYLGALAESGPVPAHLLVERASLLLRLGRIAEMLVDLRRARHLARDEDDEELLREIDRRLREHGVDG